jgi:hypothetical protein
VTNARDRTSLFPNPGPLRLVPPLGINDTGNNKNRYKYNENDRCDTHHDVSPKNAKTHYKIWWKPTLSVCDSHHRGPACRLNVASPHPGPLR